MALYYLGLAACSFFNTFSGVRYSRTTNTVFSLAIFSCITCTIASLFFLILTGFHPVFNGVTTIYALIFAAICLVSQYTGIAIFRYADIVGSGIVRGGASLLLTCLLGITVFGEEFNGFVGARIACRLGASILVLLQQRHANVRKCTTIGWIISAFMVINGVASTLITKLYATDTRVTDENSYFLLTNLFCLIVSLVVALASRRGRMADCVEEVRRIRPKQYGYIVMNTLSSNVSSLLTVAILSTGDIVFHTPLSGAIGFLITQVIAVFIEKERFSPLPVALALAATILSFWG